MKRIIGGCCLLLIITAVISYFFDHSPSPTSPAASKSAPTALAAPAADHSGNYLEALARYRTNQPTHWRHVLLQH
jgi:hypothetical protein